MIVPFFIFISASFIAGGLNSAFIKIGALEFPPLTLTWIRVVGATLIFLPFWLQKKQVIPLKQLPGIFPFGINLALFSIGIQETSVIMANIIYTSVPIIVALLSYFLLKEKLSRLSIIGLILSIIGAAILLQGSLKTADVLSFGKPFGNLIVFLASVSWAIWYITSRSLTKHYSNITILFYAFLLSSILLIPPLPIEWLLKPFSLADITWKGISIILGLIFLSSLLLQILNQWLIKKTSAFFASFVQYGALIFSYSSGTIIFHEYLTLELLIGGSLIVFGVFLATTYNHIRSRQNS